jgi:uncharacterized protein YegP (UPF0339 family)
MADYSLDIYKDKRGEFRWRCFSAANGKQVGRASEGFASPSGCKGNAKMNGHKG